MFSIAGAIGTGLIIGSGTALARGGPASMLLAYSIIGVVIYFVMTSLGEMAEFLPMDQGFNGYATRYVDPALGFATGWNYFFKYAMVLPNNLTAAGLIIQYCRPDLNVAIWVTIFAVVIITINFLHVTSFGESEFILATIKALVLIVVILTCFIISAGGSPSRQTIGFRYWHEPGAFASFLVPSKTGQFLGFWACLVQACFAYTGTEVVGAAYGETPNPRRNIPRSVGQTLWRICIFYILGVWALGMAVPYNNENLVGATKAKISAAASPFVIAIKLAGIKYLPDIVNACLLVFVTSSANTDIYVASRTLYSLAKDGHAPQIFRKTNARGVPIYAVGFSSLFALLAYMNVNTAASTVFGYFVGLVTVFGTTNWINILCAYVGFRKGLKAQGIPLTDLPYRRPFQPYGAYMSLGLTILITFFNGYNAFIPIFTVSIFLTSYIGIVLYIALLFGWKIIHQTKRVMPLKMDLHTDRRRYEDEEAEADIQRAAKGQLPFWKLPFAKVFSC